MIIRVVSTDEIVATVTKAIVSATTEILATMLMGEELLHPLPEKYHKLLSAKVREGIVLRRLGFGSRDEYNRLANRYLQHDAFEFKYQEKISRYQRMICVDGRVLFFGTDGVFLATTYKPLIDVFKTYFIGEFEKTKL